MNALLAKQLATLMEKKEQLSLQLKLLNQMITDVSQCLYNEFVDSGLSNIRVEGTDPKSGEKVLLDGKDRIVSPDIITRPNVTAKNAEDFLVWMEKNDFQSLIKRHVPPQSLKKWVNERMEANLDLPPENLMTVFTEETVKVTRAPSRT